MTSAESFNNFGEILSWPATLDALIVESRLNISVIE